VHGFICLATDGRGSPAAPRQDGVPQGSSTRRRISFATGPVKFRPRNDRREPWSDAGPIREIVQPAGNLQELGGTGNSARGYQELESTIEHGSTAGICHGKSSHRALGDLLVARWQLCTSLANVRIAWRWRLQCLSRTFQFGSFQCSLEPQRRNDDPTQLQRVRATQRVAFSFGPGNSPWYSAENGILSCPNTNIALSVE
jgi:hypothetical protein